MTLLKQTFADKQVQDLLWSRRWHQSMITTIDEKLKKISKEHQKIISME